MGRIIPGGAGPLPATADVVVIGGGIAGATDAFFLGRHGLSAVVLERAPQLAFAHHRTGRRLLPGPVGRSRLRRARPPQHRASTRRSRRRPASRLVDRAPAAGLAVPHGRRRRAGGVRAVRRGHPLLRRARLRAPRRRRVRRRFPWVAERITAATFRACDGWVSPVRGRPRPGPASAARAPPRDGGARDRGGRRAGHRGADRAGRHRHAARRGLGRAVLATAGRHGGRRPAGDDGPPPPGDDRAPAGDPGRRPDDARRGHPRLLAARGRRRVPGHGPGPAGTEPADPVPTDWTFPAVVMDAASRAVPFWSGDRRPADRGRGQPRRGPVHLHRGRAAR